MKDSPCFLQQPMLERASNKRMKSMLNARDMEREP